MPIVEGFFGTESDGGPSMDYCIYCYQEGVFTEPSLTKEGMIEKSTAHMQSELHLPEEESRILASNFIPKLKRWSS